MKKYINIIIVCLLLFSCGGGEDSIDDIITEPDPVINEAPNSPTLISPTNNMICIDNSVPFSWNTSIDPEGDQITYQIQVSKNNDFGTIDHSYETTSLDRSILLDRGDTYFWRIRATDSKDASSLYSTTFSFYTEGDPLINHLPYAPEIVKPAIDETVQTSSTILEWTASDIDTNDTLTYDVFLGTENPPATKVGDNISTTSMEVNLSPSTIYYWSIIVKDSNNGYTNGQVWNFKTN